MNLVAGGLADIAWKIGAVVAGIVALGLGIYLATVEIDRGRIKQEYAVAEASINDPKTGYVAKLAQADTNATELQAQIEQQNASITAQSAADAANLAASTKALAASQAIVSADEAKLAVFLASPLTGVTDCAQAADVHTQAQDLLK